MNVLLENGSAYHCFCTERRLELLRKEAMRLQEIPKYDNKCRSLSRDTVKQRLNNGEPCCIRFKVSKLLHFLHYNILNPITFLDKQQ